MPGGELPVRKLIFLPRANLDYAESLDWYATHDAKAADRFESEIDRSVQDIRSDPLRWPLIDKTHRQCIVRGFPFAIIYRINGEELLVIAVAHASRRPGYWREK